MIVIVTVIELQTKELSLPVQRECVDVKLSYARLLLSMLSLHINDERRKMVLKLQKPAVLQVTSWTTAVLWISCGLQFSISVYFSLILSVNVITTQL